MYMTSALPKSDMKGLGLQLALDLVHENERTDLITGLQTRTQTGRPDFDVVRQNSQSCIQQYSEYVYCQAVQQSISDITLISVHRNV